VSGGAPDCPVRQATEGKNCLPGMLSTAPSYLGAIKGTPRRKVPLLCDNESAIRIADNPVEHSRTKHIDIRHHFLRDHQQTGDIEVFHVSTENQLADIFTKPLDEKTFCRLRSELNVLDS
jgi:hypothetical protein